MDCRAEVLDWSLFAIPISALLPVLATALVSQTMTDWVKVLLQALTTSHMPQSSVEFADQLVRGLK